MQDLSRFLFYESKWSHLEVRQKDKRQKIKIEGQNNKKTKDKRQKTKDRRTKRQETKCYNL